jgi:lipopolysaccharide transport system ATP-binding protein
MAKAVVVENLSKRFMLGETFAGTLRERLARALTRSAANHTQEEFWALRDVSFEVEQGEAIGIIGGNGAGKSTLLKILSRITPPTTGRALVRGRLSSLLEVGTGFHPELTGRENVYLNGAILGMRKQEIARKFDEIVDFAGVSKFIDTPVKRYSSGMHVRLGFAVAAHLEPDVMVIDEVLAVGDAEFQKRCLGKMGEVARAGRTVLFVSHNMAAVQRLCGRAVWLRGGQVVDAGPSSEIVPRYLNDQTRSVAGGQIRPGVLYEDLDSTSAGPAWVERVDLRDAAGEPIAALSTWDHVRLRIRFRSAQRYRAFSAVLQVTTIDGTPLLLTSTTPDRTLAFGVDAGVYEYDCEFPRFPLAAGEYLLGVGLAIPGVEYVWRKDDLCRIQVQAKDVYGSGLPPAANRYCVATEHQWHRVESMGRQDTPGAFKVAHGAL